MKPCDEFADCTNTVGGYKCKCKEGYRGSGHWCKKIEIHGTQFFT